MIQPAFPGQATKQDAMACLKRAHWTVNLNHAVYVRQSGVNEDPVPLVTFPPDEPDFISDEGKKVLGAMRQGISIAQDIWLEKRQWSHDLVSICFWKVNDFLLEHLPFTPLLCLTSRNALLRIRQSFLLRSCLLSLCFGIRNKLRHHFCKLRVFPKLFRNIRTAPNPSEPAPPSPPPAPSSSRPASTLAPKDASAPVTLTAVKEEINNDINSLENAAFMFPNLLGKGIADVIDLNSPSPQPKQARTGAEAAEEIALEPASDFQAGIEEEMDYQFPDIGAADNDES